MLFQVKNGHFGYSPKNLVLEGIDFQIHSGEILSVLGCSAHLPTFGMPGAKDEKIALEALERVGILHLKDKLCGRISGGELQMALIARALAAQPLMLILDEPESGLDFKNQDVRILDVLDRGRSFTCVMPSSSGRVA